MALQYTRTRGDLGGGDYRRMASEVKEIIEEEMTVSGREGAARAREHLDSAGTGRTWSAGPWGAGGTGDRVQSDTMRDSLGYRIIRGASVGLDVGWTDVWMAYFGYQDEGFSTSGFRNGPSITVKGMGVISDLEVFMRGKVDEALDRATRRIVDAL